MSKKYDGEPLDMSWQTAPWNNDGETIDAHDSEGDGEIMTIDWPENATPYDELNENQRQMIMTAARYPKVNSPQELLEKSGLSLSDQYPNNVLRKHWPERYWGQTEGYGSDESAETDEEPDVYNDVEDIRRRILNGETLREVAQDYPVCKDTVGKVARGKVDELPHSEIPALVWQNAGDQGWRIANNDNGSETDSVTEDTETNDVMPDPVRHTPEPASSSLPAWVWAVVGAVAAWIASKLLG